MDQFLLPNRLRYHRFGQTAKNGPILVVLTSLIIVWGQFFERIFEPTEKFTPTEKLPPTPRWHLAQFGPTETFAPTETFVPTEKFAPSRAFKNSTLILGSWNLCSRFICLIIRTRHLYIHTFDLKNHNFFNITYKCIFTKILISFDLNLK
jgi:hypothetical protein